MKFWPKAAKAYRHGLDDERDKTNNLKKRSFALIFGAVVLVLTYVYKKCFRMYTYDLGVLLWSCVLGYFLCSAKLKPGPPSSWRRGSCCLTWWDF